MYCVKETIKILKSIKASKTVPILDNVKITSGERFSTLTGVSGSFDFGMWEIAMPCYGEPFEVLVNREQLIKSLVFLKSEVALSFQFNTDEDVIVADGEKKPLSTTEGTLHMVAMTGKHLTLQAITPEDYPELPSDFGDVEKTIKFTRTLWDSILMSRSYVSDDVARKIIASPLIYKGGVYATTGRWLYGDQTLDIGFGFDDNRKDAEGEVVGFMSCLTVPELYINPNDAQVIEFYDRYQVIFGGGFKVVCKRVDGTPPNVLTVIPESHILVSTIYIGGLQDFLMLGSSKKNPGTVTFALREHSTSIDVSLKEPENPIPYKCTIGNQIESDYTTECHFNAEFLKQVIKDGFTTIGLQNPMYNATKITSNGVSGRFVVLMPMRD